MAQHHVAFIAPQPFVIGAAVPHHIAHPLNNGYITRRRTAIKSTDATHAGKFVQDDESPPDFDPKPQTASAQPDGVSPDAN